MSQDNLCGAAYMQVFLLSSASLQVLYALWSKRRMGQWDDDFVDDPESSGEDY